MRTLLGYWPVIALVSLLSTTVLAAPEETNKVPEAQPSVPLPEPKPKPKPSAPPVPSAEAAKPKPVPKPEAEPKVDFPKAALKKALEEGVPKKAFFKALRFMDANRATVTNRKYVALVNFAIPMKDKRLYVVNLQTGTVGRFYVTHGKGSDPKVTGVAQQFSNTVNSGMSSLGFYLTTYAYTGDYGYSMRLKGLSESNSKVEERAVVFHPYYVGPGYEETYEKYRGVRCVDGGCLTQGCFGVAHSVATKLVDLLKNGAIIYAFK